MNGSAGRVYGLPSASAEAPSNHVKAPSERPKPSESQRSDAGAASARDPRGSIHCYGGKGALCWDPGFTRGDEPAPTVFLQGANAISEKVYSWKEKITLQLNHMEMLGVLAVLRRIRPSFEGKNHGEGKDKGFSIEDQGDKFFVRIFQKGGMRAVPMDLEGAMEVSVLLTQQLLMTYNVSGIPKMSDVAVLQLHASMFRQKSA